MMANETTERKFSDWCKVKGYYRLKLQVNISNLLLGQMTPTPSDFLVLTKDKTHFIEVKEVLKNDSFPNSRFRQQFKLTKLSKTFPNVGCYILINFVAQKKIAFLEVMVYNDLITKINQRALKLAKIPSEYLFDWRTLRI